MDKVFIEGLEIEALIGIYDWERRIRQPLVFDLEMQFDNRIPAASDDIKDTLDYKAVSKRVIDYVGQSQFGLVETLAERVALIVVEEFGVAHVRLKLSKPGAVRGARAVGVIIERTRQSAQAPERVPAQAGVRADTAGGTPAQEGTAPRTDRAAALAASGVDESVAASAEAAVVAAGTAPAIAEATDAEGADTAATPVSDDVRLQAALSAAVSGWHTPAEASAGAATAIAFAATQAPAGESPEPATPHSPSDGQPAAASDAAVAAASDVVDTVEEDLPPPGAVAAIDESIPAQSEPESAADAQAPAAPASTPSQRANFMRDLDEAPVLPGVSMIDALSPATESTPPPAPASGAAVHSTFEPPTVPSTFAVTPAKEARATEAHAPEAPGSEVPAPEAPASEVLATELRASEAPASEAPAATPSASTAAPAPGTVSAPGVRTAPPPPPRPRNPASDLGRTTRPAYLSLGSNIEPEQNLRSALMALRARFGEVIVSPVYRIPAVGFEGPDFLNAAAIIDSDLDPFALTRWLRGIESAHGRMRTHVKNSNRTLDMDIIFFDDLVLDMPGLQLPRPELRHAFVLKPLVDIAPGFVDPVRGVPLLDVWSSHPEHDERFAVVTV